MKKTILLLWLSSSAYATLGGNCGSASPPQMCGPGPGFACNQWIGATIQVWDTISTGSCVADVTSPTGYSQANTTRLNFYKTGGPCACIVGGICGCSETFLSSAAGTGTCTVSCPSPLRACTGFTGWANGACAVGGCAPGQRQQTRTATPASCTGSPGPFNQCVADPTCNVPLFPSCSVTPTSIFAGDPATLAWTAANATSVSINQGIGAVPTSGTQVVTPPLTITYTITATNANGSATCNLPLIVSPPPPRCGAGTICGDLHAAEINTLAIPNWPVEIKNSQGQTVQTIFSDGSGHYTTSLPNGSYYPLPAAGRNMGRSPSQPLLPTNNVITNGAFLLRGVPASLTITAPLDTFILITTFSYTGAIPPVMDASKQATYAVTATAGTSGSAVAHVLGGQSYWLTCWPDLPGIGYKNTGSVSLKAGGTVWPLDQIAGVCP